MNGDNVETNGQQYVQIWIFQAYVCVSVQYLYQAHQFCVSCCLFMSACYALELASSGLPSVYFTLGTEHPYAPLKDTLQTLEIIRLP